MGTIEHCHNKLLENRSSADKYISTKSVAVVEGKKWPIIFGQREREGEEEVGG